MKISLGSKKPEKQLNEFTYSLHLIRQPLGLSVRDVFGKLAKLNQFSYINTGLADIDRINAGTLAEKERLINELTHLWKIIQLGESFVWYGLPIHL